LPFSQILRIMFCFNVLQQIDVVYLKLRVTGTVKAGTPNVYEISEAITIPGIKRNGIQIFIFISRFLLELETSTTIEIKKLLYSPNTKPIG